MTARPTPERLAKVRELVTVYTAPGRCLGDCCARKTVVDGVFRDLLAEIDALQAEARVLAGAVRESSAGDAWIGGEP